MTNMQDTIAAIATPPGVGGIGIVRISGTKALSIAKGLFRGKAAFKREETERHLENPQKSHYFRYGHIHDPHKGVIVDEVMLVCMLGPRSYTREDVVEIQAHGGSVVLNKVLELVLNAGARAAAPGEFTKRAFLNGRIDLCQAEAVIEMVNAQTERALEMASAQLRGGMADELNNAENLLEALLSAMSAAIEFPEQELALNATAEYVQRIESELLVKLEALLESFKNKNVFRDGIRVAIVGSPNAGKSTLLNRLLGKERAIVTDIPGTTRDLIEETIHIQGIPLRVTDTAGFHEATDRIDILSIQKSISAIEESEIILMLIEGGRKRNSQDVELLDKIRNKPHLVLLNKCDLLGGPALEDAIQWGQAEALAVSAKYGTNIDALKKRLVHEIMKSRQGEEQTEIVPNQRQRRLLQEAREELRVGCHAFKKGIPEDIAMLNWQAALNKIKAVRGEGVAGDLLEKIFNRFCVGK